MKQILLFAMLIEVNNSWLLMNESLTLSEMLFFSVVIRAFDRSVFAFIMNDENCRRNCNQWSGHSTADGSLIKIGTFRQFATRLETISLRRLQNRHSFDAIVVTSTVRRSQTIISNSYCYYHRLKSTATSIKIEGSKTKRREFLFFQSNRDDLVGVACEHVQMQT